MRKVAAWFVIFAALFVTFTSVWILPALFDLLLLTGNTGFAFGVGCLVLGGSLGLTYCIIWALKTI